MGMDKEPAKSLMVRIKRRAGTGGFVVGVSYRPGRLEDEDPLWTDRSSLTFTSSGAHGGTSAARISVGGTTQQFRRFLEWCQ